MVTRAHGFMGCGGLLAIVGYIFNWAARQSSVDLLNSAHHGPGKTFKINSKDVCNKLNKNDFTEGGLGIDIEYDPKKVKTSCEDIQVTATFTPQGQPSKPLTCEDKCDDKDKDNKSLKWRCVIAYEGKLTSVIGKRGKKHTTFDCTPGEYEIKSSQPVLWLTLKEGLAKLAGGIAAAMAGAVGMFVLCCCGLLCCCIGGCTSARQPTAIQEPLIAGQEDFIRSVA
jgi:hypothetical protein